MAPIVDALLSKFNELVAQMVQDEVFMLLGVPREIKKLGQTVRDIQDVLDDAEKKQIESKPIESWLIELKDVMYDADDIMDLCQIKYEERRTRSNSPSSAKVGCGCFHLLSCFRNPAFAHEIGTKIKEVNARLESIVNRKTDLGLIGIQSVSPPVSHSYGGQDSIIHHTDSLVVMNDLVGDKMEEDAKLLVDWLIEEENSEKRSIGVIGIQGMGGIGKTTLAKRIFNDPIINEEFNLKIWICVSKDVKGVELLKSIIQQAGGEVGVAEGREVLVRSLQKIIKGKKFFLVMDDVWPESTAVWDGLLSAPMNSGVQGSRLLVTTRDERVVNGINATKSHRVDKLSDEDGWNLLIKQVFQNEKDSEIQEFKDIGMELVRKCDGLPLAIKSISGVLRTRSKSIRQWEEVLRSSVWSMNKFPNDIYRALYLSYEDLSLPLKKCFIICSLYPEDYIFNRPVLIHHWIAEGFLQGTDNPWKKGIEYYYELLLRNLLEYYNISHLEFKCKMHDLLWSFAHHLDKGENNILAEGDILNKPRNATKLRRLSIVGNKESFEDVKNEIGVRTLLIGGIPENVLDDLCTTLLNLRILNITCSNISNLPNSLFFLVHLRYLHASMVKIRTIPESIGRLKNLVYLDFSNCKELTHVPHKITNLNKLMCLSFFSTNFEGIPSGLKNFKKLTHLLGFKPDNNSSKGLSGLEELEPLLHLVTLQLENLDKITDINAANGAKLRCKDQLQHLILSYTKLHRKDQVSQTNEKKVTTEGVLNELCPPRSLETLKIHGYFGCTLPNWLNLGANLPYLRFLEIKNCNCIKSLAPLGQLSNLNLLRIAFSCSIELIGEEFFLEDIERKGTKVGSCSIVPAFPKLTELTFEQLYNWKGWHWNKEETAMPKLKKLCIRNCPKLKYLPKGLSYHATSLEYLEIKNANALTQVENFSSIQHITLFQNQNLRRISNLPKITHIKIEICPNLKTVDNLSALHKMDLVDPEMKFLPNYLLKITPSKLRVTCSEQLLLIITSRDNGSEWHKFKHISNVTIYTIDESQHTTYQKTPFSFTTNVLG